MAAVEAKDDLPTEGSATGIGKDGAPFRSQITMACSPAVSVIDALNEWEVGLHRGIYVHAQGRHTRWRPRLVTVAEHSQRLNDSFEAESYGQCAKPDGPIVPIPDRPGEPVSPLRQPHLDRADRRGSRGRASMNIGDVVFGQALGRVDSGDDRLVYKFHRSQG